MGVTPADKTADGVLDTPRSVCLLRSRRLEMPTSPIIFEYMQHLLSDSNFSQLRVFRRTCILLKFTF